MPYLQFDYLGEDPPMGLRLISLSGREAISELFCYELLLESIDSKEIKPTDIIGQDISIHLDYFELQSSKDREARFVHGIVNSFKIVEGFNLGADIRRYSIELVPELWFLTKSSNIKVFEQKKSSDIIQSILSDHGIRANISSTSPVREHCIQFMETDYEFVTRLMTDEGLIYYFEYSDHEHKLVIADSNTYGSSSSSLGMNSILSWSPTFNYISGEWAAGDYSYLSRAQSIHKKKASTIKGLDNRKHKQVVTGARIGGEGQASVLEQQVEVLSGREDASFEVIAVISDNKLICAGQTFSVDDRNSLPDDTASEIVVIEATHQMDESKPYTNQFHCIPSDRSYWGKENPVRPIIRGPLTAQVMENVDPESLGRIKVKFLADEPYDEENVSTWIRVSQVMSGKEMGAMFTPRINDEVVVSFINGNPDRPLIIGSLYNATNKPPKDNEKKEFTETRNGFVTPSSELIFEDEEGGELFHVRANHDYKRVVVKNDTLEIEGDRSIKIEGKDENVITGDRTTKISGKEVREITGNVQLKSSASINLSAKSKIELKVGSNTLSMDSMGIELKVGGNSIEISQSGITVKGTMVKVEGSTKADVKSPMTTLSGDGMVTVKGGVVMIN